MQMRDQAKTATPDLTSGWKSIPGDLQLKPSVNADLKFRAYNEGETEFRFSVLDIDPVNG